MEETEKSFKTCTFCKMNWETIASLIADENLRVNGYQASFSNSYEGLFLLTHNLKECGTTIAIRASLLRSLYEGEEYPESNYGNPSCPGHCTRINDLEPCDQECSMRWARDVLQVLKSHGRQKVF